MNKYKQLNLLFLICLDTIFFILIISLSFRLYPFFSKKILGTQYETKVKREHVIFPVNDSGFKFFYEPLPNSEDIQNPEWLGYTVINKINSDGLNEKQDYSIKKEQSTYRILTIGDSFTYGLYVESKNSYPKQLEKLLNSKLSCSNIKKFEVINIGVGGYDVNYTVERFLKRGVKYQPDLVIWLVNSWNIEQLVELAQPIQRQLEKNGDLLFNPDNGEHLQNKANKILREKYDLKDIVDFQIERIKYLIENFDGNILLSSMNGFPTNYQNLFYSFENQGLKVKYNSSIFNTYSDRKYRLIDDHPNIIGHQEISKSFFDYLVENYFKECKY